MPKIHIKPLSLAALTGGTVTAVLYGCYFIKLMLMPEGVLAFSITVIVLVLSIIPLVFHGFFSRKLGRAYKPLKIIYAVLTCFYTVSFAVMCVFVFSFSKEPSSPPSSGDVVLVFGCKNYDYGPGKTLRARLDKAAELLEESPEALCAVSGGQGVDEPRPEAETMKIYLMEKGISQDRIIVEDKSRNTRQNIENTISLLNQNNIQYTGIACVSNRFHLARISLMCKDLGIDAKYYPTADDKYGLLSMLVREYMSIVHYFIFGE